ncbi:MAG: hypothetical protein Q8Q20_01765 [bacterium]|nr:hypothetical protein [bacterium]
MVHSNYRRQAVASGKESKKLLRLMDSVLGLWHSGARPLKWLNTRLVNILPDSSLVFCDDEPGRLLQIVSQIYLEAQSGNENMKKVLQGLQAINDQPYVLPCFLQPFGDVLDRKQLVTIAGVLEPFLEPEWRIHLTSPWLTKEDVRTVIAPGSLLMSFRTPGDFPHKIDRLEYEIRDNDADVISCVGDQVFSRLCDLVAKGPWNESFGGWRDDMKSILMYTYQAVLLHAICHSLVGGSARWSRYLEIWQRGGNYPLGYIPETKHLLILVGESSPE